MVIERAVPPLWQALTSEEQEVLLVMQRTAEAAGHKEAQEAAAREEYEAALARAKAHWERARIQPEEQPLFQRLGAAVADRVAWDAGLYEFLHDELLRRQYARCQAEHAAERRAEQRALRRAGRPAVLQCRLNLLSDSVNDVANALTELEPAFSELRSAVGVLKDDLARALATAERALTEKGDSP